MERRSCSKTSLHTVCLFQWYDLSGDFLKMFDLGGCLLKFIILVVVC